jgi:hypothetical protein
MTSCFSCGSNKNKVLACTGCRTAFYCDTTCQTVDWKARHQNDCHLLKEMCEIGARLSLSGSELIGKPVKRGASTSPSSEDKRETKRANAVPVSPGSSEATASAAAPSARERETDLRRVFYPLPKDLFRLIALMVKLDAPALMRSSPAWAIFYEQIEWKNILLSRWDAPSENKEAARKGAASIGQWLYAHDIFDLYPNVLLDRSLYILTREQQEEVSAINQERRERLEASDIARGALGPDDEFIFDRGLESAMEGMYAREDRLEYGIFLGRVQAIPVNQDTQRALINIFMLYYMYEENIALLPMDHFLLSSDGEGIRMAYGLQSRNGKNIELSNGDSDLEESMFFPVEVLTDPLPAQDLEFITYDGWTGNDLMSILDVARYDEFLKQFGPDIVRRFGGFKLNLELTSIKNFPGALVQCNSIIRTLGFRQCGSFSERSFANLAKMARLENISAFMCEWETVSADFYATCPRLKKVALRWQDEFTPRRVRVSPSVLRESVTPGVFAACPVPSNNKGYKFPEFDLVVNTGMDETMRARILPPGPFGGLSRDAHVKRILRSAFITGDKKEDKGAEMLFLRLEQALIKQRLLPVSDISREDVEGDIGISAFILALESTGISPIAAAQDVRDGGNVTLPFRTWFENGLEYTSTESSRMTIRTVKSYAVEACTLSAIARRGEDAKISIEELAEALVAWNASVYNLALCKIHTNDPRRKYCQYIERYGIAKRVKDPVDDSLAWLWSIAPPTEFLPGSFAKMKIPHEMVMSLREQLIKNVSQKDLYCHCVFKLFLGQLPAWLWLLPKKVDAISVVNGRSFSLPTQLMYHPGLHTMKVMDTSGWGTPDGEPQWDLFHLAPEARPGPAEANEGTRMHQYFHDFARLDLRMTEAPWTCFPPMDLSTYDASIFLDFK